MDSGALNKYSSARSAGLSLARRFEGIDILRESRMFAAIYVTHSESLSPFCLWEKGRG